MQEEDNQLPAFTVGTNLLMSLAFGPQVTAEYASGTNTSLYLDAQYIKSVGPFGIFVGLGEGLAGSEITGGCLKPGFRYYWSRALEGFFIDSGIYCFLIKYKYPKDERGIFEFFGNDRERPETIYRFFSIFTVSGGYRWTWDNFFLGITGFIGEPIERDLRTPLYWADISLGVPF